MGNFWVLDGHLSRKEVAWIVAILFLLTAFFLLIADGYPIPLAVLGSPFAVLSVAVSGGWVTMIWFLFVLIRVALVGQDVLDWIRGTVTAILLGLTPHALFLMVLNSRLTRSWHSLDGVEKLGSWAITYEVRVLALHERWSSLLLPSPMLGAVAGALVLAAAFWLRRPVLNRFWNALADSARWVGICLLAASSFTVATATPFERWRPDTAVLVRERISDAAKTVATLSLYQQANAELMQSPDEWRKPLIAMAVAVPDLRSRNALRVTEIEPHWIADEVAHHSAPADQRLKWMLDRLRSQKQTPHVAPSPNGSRADADALRLAILDAEARTEGESKQFRELVAGAIAGAASDYAKRYAGELASAFIEDAAKVLAGKVIGSVPAPGDLLRWMDGTFVPVHMRAWLTDQFEQAKEIMSRPDVVWQVKANLEGHARSAEMARVNRERAEFERRVRQMAEGRRVRR